MSYQPERPVPKIPGWLHIVYFLGGFVTFGVLWVVWLIHALLVAPFKLGTRVGNATISRANLRQMEYDRAWQRYQYELAWWQYQQDLAAWQERQKQTDAGS
jgi:hypothetical protein